MMSAISSTLVLSSVLLLTACSDTGPTSQTDQAGLAEPNEVAQHADHESLSLPKRLAFMTGHVEAGLALYRAGEPDMAAPHLLHPVSETHAAERVGLDALGFDAQLFERVSKALEDGLPATQIQPQLLAAEQNLQMVADKAGGDPGEIIEFLMATVLEEYAVGVSGDQVTDIGEYQDAIGFVTVALARAEALRGSEGDQLGYELKRLLGMWPSAPIPPKFVRELSEIEQQVERVRRALIKTH